MKITKFAQSCLLIETKGKRILIDPGSLQYNPSYLQNEWAKIDLILITHKHTDHCNEEAIKQIQSSPYNTPIISSKEVQAAFPNLRIQIVKPGEMLNSAGPRRGEGIKIEVTRAVHGYHSELRGPREIHDNIGFIIEENTTRVYITSDTIDFPNDYKCDIVALPISNHGLVFGAFEAAHFAKDTGAKLLIPLHYDNPKYPINREQVETEFQKQAINYKFLDIAESIEL